MSVTFGGQSAWKVQVKGELVIAYHWVNKDPAMVLLPKRKPLGWSAFIIPIGVVQAWVKSNGYPTAEAIERGFKAAEVMGIFPTKDTVRNIVEAVCDGVPDLFSMPPEPDGLNQKQQNVVGEAVLKLGGKTIAEVPVEALPSSIYVPDQRLH